MRIKWSKIFDWKIKSVSEPISLMIDYEDVGERLTAYELKIEYEHHGEVKILFGIDDKLGLVTKDQAFNKACAYRNKLLGRLERQYV